MHYLICSLVMSHLDYGNGLLVGVMVKGITKMQCVQIVAAKAVFKKKIKNDSTSRARFKLHWLQIQG